VFYKDSHEIYRARPLGRMAWLVHGFGTRWSKSFGSCGNLATLRQVHSNTVIAANGRAGCLGEGDALLDDTPGMLLAVRTADCLPILLVDERNRAVAAVHAGWRGTAAGIVGETVKAMREKFSTRPEDVHAAIGPGIGGCCFEVGAEVAAQFGGKSDCKTKINLVEINREQLLASGVAGARIYTAELCTVCNVDDFFSFRRQKNDAGRMLSVVGTHKGRGVAAAPFVE